MNIEIKQPELAALIEQRMASGAFHNVEEVLIHALKSAPLSRVPSQRTGADLIAAMQAMPHKEDVEFEHSRPHMPVRDVTL